MIDVSPYIAVVDDDPAVVKGLTRLLQTRSAKVCGFLSAQEFLSALLKGLPDCLIIDLNMPGMNGFELLWRLANCKIEIPIIVITAHDDAGLSGRCLSAGAFALLLKPVQHSALFAALDAAIAGRRIPSQQR
jgi:FixJ family two-component response regulator